MSTSYLVYFYIYMHNQDNIFINRNLTKSYLTLFEPT